MENIHWHVPDSICGKIRKRNRTHTLETHMNPDPTLYKHAHPALHTSKIYPSIC